MTAIRTRPGAYRTSGGVFYKVVGEGKPLLLLHGLLATGVMFDPLVDLLRADFCMVIPDLRGHGESGDLDGPYDVSALAADLDSIIEESGFERPAVMGYSHGGAVAQQFVYTRPSHVSKMMLTCTYACNVGTVKERIEASVLTTLLTFFSPKTIVNLVVRPSASSGDGPIGLTVAQAEWLRALMSKNHARQMRGASHGLVTFDSRPWLGEIKSPTLVVGGTHDTAVPQYHFDTLVQGIPGARGKLVERAGHTLIWTHTRELAEIMRHEW